MTLAANSKFPPHDDRRLARIFELLSVHRTIGDGWVAREKIAQFWPAARTDSLEERRRVCNRVTNAIKNLREQIAQNLSWILPHFIIEVEGFPADRAVRYRLKVERREPAWDFVNDEAPRTLPLRFAFRFSGGKIHSLKMRVWAHATPNHSLQITAVREPADGEWAPPSANNAYKKRRDTYFAERAAAHLKATGQELHAGDIWGIKAAHVTAGESVTRVQIETERTTFPDLVFLKANFDHTFDALSKHTTYRQWLRSDDEPRQGWCAPRDALCVSVMIVTRKPTPTIFVAKQRAGGMWEATAAGAASSSHVHVDDENPDLEGQVTGVVYREIGLKVAKQEIKWIGFARGIERGNTNVIAMIEVPFTVQEVLQKFDRRREKDDVEDLKPLPVSEAGGWIENLAPRERGEFLELALGLTAMQFGAAELA
jgi:hypothetical protein